MGYGYPCRRVASLCNIIIWDDAREVIEIYMVLDPYKESKTIMTLSSFNTCICLRLTICDIRLASDDSLVIAHKLYLPCAFDLLPFCWAARYLLDPLVE